MSRAYAADNFNSLKIRNCIIKLISLQHYSIVIQQYSPASIKILIKYLYFCLNFLFHIYIIVSNYSFFNKRSLKERVQINILCKTLARIFPY
jgi:hypothetical protein